LTEMIAALWAEESPNTIKRIVDNVNRPERNQRAGQVQQKANRLAEVPLAERRWGKGEIVG
jgi:hypothetical protein